MHAIYTWVMLTSLYKRADAFILIYQVQDARRFIMCRKWAIENSLLQEYASALLFSLECSLIKAPFKEE